MEPTLELLTGPEAGAVLAAAVESAGGQMLGWRATQVDHRPGRSVSVAYAVRVAWPDGERDETFAAAAGRPGGPWPGVLQVSDGERSVEVWRYPDDPRLPALAAAGDAEDVRLLLVDLGLCPAGTAAQAVQLITRTYRPGRRAVIEARFPTASGALGQVFLKVTRPARIAELHRRHRVLRDAGVPVPEPLGWTDSGLLVLGALAGRGLRSSVRREGAAAVRAQDLVEVLDELPEDLLALPGRPSWTDAAAHYAAVVGAALPVEATRAEDLADRIVSGLTGCDEPIVAVHGDFYEAQLFVAGGRLTGVLDVDSAGPGRRGDDLGCMLAHLEVLAQIDERQGDTLRAGRIRECVTTWLPTFDRADGCDPRALRLRTAGVLMSLATGPHRVQDDDWQAATTARLNLATRWLDDAGTV